MTYRPRWLRTRVTPQITALRVQPGDILVLRTEQALSHWQQAKTRCTTCGGPYEIRQYSQGSGSRRFCRICQRRAQREHRERKRVARA